MKVLVTGATGVVGRRLVPILAGQGHTVSALSHGADSEGRIARLGATPVTADFFDPASLRRAAAGCDAVVNLATHMPSSPLKTLRRSAWKENDRIRREGSCHLVDAALAEGVGRFVQESFAPTYPDSGDRWIEENTPLVPAAYNQTVIDAEHSAKRFTDAGRTGIVLRFAAFYGPDSRFLLDAIGQAKKGRSILPGPPEAYISSVSHDDAATAAAAALKLPAGVYNVADDEPLTRRDYLDSLARTLGVPPPKPFPRWMHWMLGPLYEFLSRSLRISNRRLKAASPWTPKYQSIREGWPEIVAAAR